MISSGKSEEMKSTCRILLDLCRSAAFCGTFCWGSVRLNSVYFDPGADVVSATSLLDYIFSTKDTVVYLKKPKPLHSILDALVQSEHLGSSTFDIEKATYQWKAEEVQQGLSELDKKWADAIAIKRARPMLRKKNASSKEEKKMNAGELDCTCIIG
eukprot:g1725.t1